MKTANLYNRLGSLSLSACCIFLLAVTSVRAGGDEARLTIKPAQNFLVSFSCPEAELRAQVEAAGGSVGHIWGTLGVSSILGLQASTAHALLSSPGITAVQQDVDVRWVNGFTPGKTVAVQSVHTENATREPSRAVFYPIQWNMEQIGAPGAWGVSHGRKDVRVGLIGTGISPDHVDLRGRYDLDNCVNLSHSNPYDRNDYIDRNMHGTMMSAIISSNNLGVASIASDVTIVGIKAIGDDGRASVSDLIDGIMYAVEQARVDIISLSLDNCDLGGDSAPLAALLCKAVKYATENDVLVVASVGDNTVSDGAHSSFAALSSTSGALLVGPTGPSAEAGNAAVACYADNDDDVSIYAPGGSRDCSTDSYSSISDMVVSALAPEVARSMNLPDPDAWYVFSSSTGISAAHATGVAALVRSVACDASPRYVVSQILKSADKVGGSAEYAGELNAVLGKK